MHEKQIWYFEGVLVGKAPPKHPQFNSWVEPNRDDAIAPGGKGDRMQFGILDAII
jgi:hypothetical protein